MEVYLNVDIGDPARYNAEPCDAKWVDEVCAKCADHGVRKLFWRVEDKTRARSENMVADATFGAVCPIGTTCSIPGRDKT